MPRRRTSTAARRTSRRSTDDISTAFLLPDLHPWLKEFFADRNLIPVMDEAWRAFPEWELVPEPELATLTVVATPILDIVAVPAPEILSAAPMPLPVESRMTNQESRVMIPPQISATAATPMATERTHHSSFIIHHSSVRPSQAPVPFVIPVDVAAPVAPSRHFLRLTTSHARHERAAAPNLIASLSPKIATPPPVLHVGAPYDELLIVNVVLGPLGVLWRTIGWPLWTFLRIPHPSALRSGIRRQISATSFRHRSFEGLFRMKSTREREHVRTQPERLIAHLPLSAYALRLDVVRHTSAFAIVLLAVLLPVKLLDLGAGFPRIRGRVLSATAEALTSFQSGGAALAHSSFEEAIAAFDRTRAALENLPQTAGTLPRLALSVGRHIPGLRSTLGRAEDGRLAGIALATASSAAARGLATLERLDLKDTNAAAILDAATASFASARTFADNARARLQNAAPQLIAPIDRAIGELRRQEHLLPVLRALGGIDHPRRILLVFQNPAELRPTGGFIGSFALVDVASGHVQSLELPGGGSYDISGISRLRVIPPDPLRLLSDTWQFHDANWFPDFPTSARKLRGFFEASGGPSVDTVVAVNAPVLERILDLTGPIRIGEQTFSATDAISVLTDTVESTSARATNQPKAVIGQLAPEILRRLLTITEHGTPRERIQLLEVLLRALEERDILLAFTDDTTARVAADARWAGAIRPIDRDGLFVVHTNIGGGKSDAAIRDDLTHTATILDDGSVVDTVTITRTHTGSESPGHVTPSERLQGLRNIDYVRVYVPRNAELLAADGFETPPSTAFEAIPTDAIPDRLLLATSLHERMDPATGIQITEELGRTVFGGWIQTPAGETRTVRFVYRLPWRYQRATTNALGNAAPADPQAYSIAIQKQPGTHATVRHTLELAPAWRATWRAENLRPVGPQTWTFEDLLTSDRFTGIMVAPKN
ncbi:MAG: DUF4012 domain-containing protein [bacterium]|nr:DUF4012 domain-containing protein [bacterium]